MAEINRMPQVTDIFRRVQQRLAPSQARGCCEYQPVKMSTKQNESGSQAV